MKWIKFSSDIPAKEGWYWLNTDKPVVVRIALYGDTLYISGQPVKVSVMPLNAKWAGPIPEPS